MGDTEFHAQHFLVGSGLRREFCCFCLLETAVCYTKFRELLRTPNTRRMHDIQHPRRISILIAYFASHNESIALRNG